MMDEDAQALQAVLDNEADGVPDAARLAAERDLVAIRRGLMLIAADIPVAPRPRRGQNWRWLAAAAIVVVALGLVAIVTVQRLGSMDRDRGPSIGVPAIPLTLKERVAAATRIVVGTVVKVERGRTGTQVEGESGDPYVLATVRIDEAIKGAGGDVVAFAYDFGSAVTSEGQARPWNVGDHVLLFLVLDEGTVSANIRPPHMQVAEGEAGRYFVDGDKVVDADFTLADVRREAR